MPEHDFEQRKPERAFSGGVAADNAVRSEERHVGSDLRGGWASREVEDERRRAQVEPPPPPPPWQRTPWPCRQEPQWRCRWWVLLQPDPNTKPHPGKKKKIKRYSFCRNGSVRLFLCSDLRIFFFFVSAVSRCETRNGYESSTSATAVRFGLGKAGESWVASVGSAAAAAGSLSAATDPEQSKKLRLRKWQMWAYSELATVRMASSASPEPEPAALRPTRRHGRSFARRFRCEEGMCRHWRFLASQILQPPGAQKEIW